MLRYALVSRSGTLGRLLSLTHGVTLDCSRYRSGSVLPIGVSAGRGDCHEDSVLTRRSSSSRSCLGRQNRHHQPEDATTELLAVLDEQRDRVRQRIDCRTPKRDVITNDIAVVSGTITKLTAASDAQ